MKQLTLLISILMAGLSTAWSSELEDLKILARKKHAEFQEWRGNIEDQKDLYVSRYSKFFKAIDNKDKIIAKKFREAYLKEEKARTYTFIFAENYLSYFADRHTRKGMPLLFFRQYDVVQDLYAFCEQYRHYYEKKNIDNMMSLVNIETVLKKRSKILEKYAAVLSKVESFQEGKGDIAAIKEEYREADWDLKDLYTIFDVLDQFYFN